MQSTPSQRLNTVRRPPNFHYLHCSVGALRKHFVCGAESPVHFGWLVSIRSVLADGRDVQVQIFANDIIHGGL
jgi:hypothetical protein